MKYISVTVLLCIFLLSCNHSASVAKTEGLSISDSVAGTRKPEFSAFLSKFRVLPKQTLTLAPTGMDTNLVKLDPGSSDTLFLTYANGLAYGLLPDTNRVYAVLWYAAVEAGALQLTVFDKYGGKTDEHALFTDSGYWDCGHGWFGKVFVKPDMTILLRDSITIFNCDSGVAPESTWKHELDSVDVKINANGKIEFAKARKTRLD